MESDIKLNKLVWQYLKKKKIVLSGFILVSIFWAVDMSLTPYLLKVIIDTISTYQGPQDRLLSLILIPSILYVSMSFLMNVMFRLYDYINLKLYPDMKAYFEQKLLSYLLNHSYAFFQNTFTGELTKKIADFIENIEPLVSIPNEWFYPRTLAVIIAGGTLFFVVHPLFTAILFIWTIIFVSNSYLLSKHSEKYAHALARNVAKLGGAISDTLANIVSVKLFNNNAHEQKHINQALENVLANERTFRWYNLFVNFIQGVSVTLLFLALFAALLYGIRQGWTSAGDFALVLSLAISFAWSVHALGQQINRFSRVVGICNASLSFLRTPHEIVDRPNAAALQVTQGAIRFQKVHFQYKNHPPIFTNLEVSIAAGEKVGLVGHSGGGKSTFIKLILRLMDTKEGEISIDGQNIKQVSQSSLRDQVGVIPQEPELFHRTIMENIRFAKPGATEEEVMQAAKNAYCHNFIMELPEQYNTFVGERGVKLSGGQKQRIAIARAFLKNAPILILDEATSSLDSVTEQEIHNALLKVMENKTTIVIAHRLSTLKNMDRILVFDKGHIVEDGALSKLLKNKQGCFHRLWEAQAEGFISPS
ncbi:ABC transporter ATP-binding protein [Legionella oakridgensis]|uniref:ABC transporter ATP-binding protein n=1 Tax=Legionella oakridgensis TaxID=29423 RepID=UPI0003DE3CB0|nr:ABC transporter ATP-binding protein [Legionella oakridgensis]ETO92373.1 ABC-type multidrug transport system, ATPase and permease components [Legionella oakridgensis RV-2-2007]